MRVGSLFSGVGMIDLGFQHAGFEVAWQVEIDQQARSVLARHWPDVPKFEDVREIGKKQLGKVDVIAGGWPCQGNSVAGARAGMNDARSGLWREVVRILEELKPRFFVGENVPGLLSVNGGNDFRRVMDDLNAAGYIVDVDICDAQFFGVPQRRRRVFFVCERLESGLKKKSEFCSRSMCIAIIRTSLAVFKGLTDPSAEWRNGSDASGLSDGLEKMMRFFNALPKQKLWQRLPSVLVECLQKSQHDCGILECGFKNAAREYSNAVVGAESTKDIGSDDGRALTESGAANSSMCSSWNNILGGGSPRTKRSTTSTESRQTTDLRIFSCAEIVLRICVATEAWMTSCPLWSEVDSLCSAALVEFMSYARRRVDDLFESDDSRSQWRVFLGKAKDNVNARGHSGAERCAEILSLASCMCGHHPASRKAREGIAATLRSRSSSRGVSPPGRGGEDDSNIVIAPTLPARKTAGGGLGTDFDCDGGLIVGSVTLQFPLREALHAGQEAKGGSGGIGVRRLTPL